MTVFKGYLLGAVRQRAVIILYIAIFLILGVVMTQSMDGSAAGVYEQKSINMAVIDRDHTALSEGLANFLDETQTLTDLPDDISVLQEELYYGNIQYVLVIPEGFEEKLISAVNENDTEQGTKGLLEGTGRPGSVQNYYIRSLAESWVSEALVYLNAGFSEEETSEHIIDSGRTDTQVTVLEGNREMSKVAGTFQYLPYILIALSCYVIGFVMLDHQRMEMIRRIQVSPVSSVQRTAETLFAIAAIGAFFFCISFIMVWLMNTGTFFDEPNRGFYALNVICILAVALSIAFLVVNVASTANGVNGLANVLALGMSFLGGVFIPVSMLSNGVRNAVRFLPVYWYEQNNELLGTHAVLDETLTGRLYEGFAYQLIFSAVVFALAIIIYKAKHHTRIPIHKRR